MNRTALARPPRSTGTGTTLTRAVSIALSAFSNKRHIQTELPHWGGDSKSAEVIIKAATAPASLTGVGWADSLAQSSVASFIGALGPASAGSELLSRGLQLEFGGSAAITVPTLIASAGATSFVAESQPIPVRQQSLAAPQLVPRKLATLTEFSHELFTLSQPNIEALVKDALVQSVGLALDAALFSNSAGDATKPPGLLFGISPLPSTTVMKDVTALATAVARVAGNGPICFVTAPEQATSLALTFPFLFPYTVMVSSALPAGTLICITPVALASATDAQPRFAISNETTYVERDDPGPDAMSAPTRSLWQSDCISLRMIFELGWLLRDQRGAAWMQNVSW